MRAIPLVIAAVLIAGCASKFAFLPTTGAAPTTGAVIDRVCVVTKYLPHEIPFTDLGRATVRKGKDQPGDVFTYIATIAKGRGGNTVHIIKSTDNRAVGYVYYIDPALRLDCAAAGGMLR